MWSMGYCAMHEPAAIGQRLDAGAQGKDGFEMNAIVIEHVPVAELPPAWRAKLAKSTDAPVTVRIEEEAQATAPAAALVTDDPLFGIWRDREDMVDVAGYVRKLRASRFNNDGSRRQG